MKKFHAAFINNLFNSSQGFTLLELVVSTFLLFIVLTAVLQIWQQGINAWSTQMDMIEIQEDLSNTLGRITGDLQEASYIVNEGYGPDAKGYYMTGYFEKSVGKEWHHLTFKKSISDEVYRYYLWDDLSTGSDTPTALFRGMGLKNKPLSNNISELKFKYLPEDRSDPKQISRVVIVLTGTASRPGPYKKSVTLRTVVRLRSDR